jgi:hypothetical protein
MELSLTLGCRVWLAYGNKARTVYRLFTQSPPRYRLDIAARLCAIVAGAIGRTATRPRVKNTEAKTSL